jgi:hypothetical protein
MVAVADEHGKLTGAQLLQIVVDEGVKPVVVIKLRQKLNITAGVPAPVRDGGVACPNCDCGD